jgi:hypothetical protein
MSETNFSQYQKEVCEVAPDPIPLKKLCPKCKPNPNFIAPDWRSLVEETYLDEATCEYKICVTINNEGDSFTGGEFRNSIGEGKKYRTREHLFRSFVQPAITLMLEDLNKLIAKQIICASYNGPAVSGYTTEELLQKYDNFENGFMDLSESPLGEDKLCPSIVAPEVLSPLNIDFKKPVSFTQLILNTSSVEIKNPFALELFARVIDFDIDPMQNLLKVLVAIPAFIIEAAPNAPTGQDIQEAALTTKNEVEIDVEKLWGQIVRLKGALYAYSKYQSHFYQTQDGFLKFKDSGKDFYCSSYNEKIDIFYKKLKKVFKENGWNIRSNIPSVTKKNADKIKILFMDGEDGNPYKIKRIEAKIKGCEYQRVLGRNNKFAKRYSKEPTIMNFIAKLDEIDAALKARESYPWLDFCVKFTYPLVVVHYGTLNEESIADTMGDCVRNNAIEFGGELKDYILNEALSLIESMAYEFNSKQTCKDLLAEDEIEKKYFDEKATAGLDAKKKVDENEGQMLDEEFDRMREKVNSLKSKAASIKSEIDREQASIDNNEGNIEFLLQKESEKRKARGEIEDSKRKITNLQKDLDKTNEEISEITNKSIELQGERQSGGLSKKNKRDLKKSAAKAARKKDGHPYLREAKKLALEELKTQDTLLSNLVDLETFMTSGKLTWTKSKDKDDKEVLERMTLCNFKGLTIAAIRCLFSGVSQEAAFKKIAESALKAMDIDVFGIFIQGLPQNVQSELRQKAKQQWDEMPMPWEEGFKEGSTREANPYLSYLGSVTNNDTVQNKRAAIEDRIAEKENEIKSKYFEITGVNEEVSQIEIDAELFGGEELTNDQIFLFQQELAKLELELGQLKKEKDNIEKELSLWPVDDKGEPVPFNELPEERQQELMEAQNNSQGTFGKALGGLQDQITTAYIEYIMDIMEIDELMSYLDKMPGGQLVQRYINKVSCSYQGLHNPPIKSFLSTLSFDPCGEGSVGLSLPKKIKDAQMPVPWSKNFLRVLRNKFIEKVETVLTQILVKAILKLIQTIDSALCKSLNTIGQTASNLLSGKNAGLDDAFRDAFCPDGNEEDLNNVKNNAFNNALGSNRNKDSYDCLFEILNATMSKQEVVDLLTNTPSNMDEDVTRRISELVNARCPDLSDVLGNPDDVKSAFGSIGNFIPPALRDYLRNESERQPEGPIFDSICLTQQELNDWNENRRRIYLDNGLDNNLAQELIDKANERALNDLGLVSDMLQKGPQGLLEQAIDDLLNQKDPDCSVDNKAFIMEDVESAADKLEDLNDYFKRIEKVFMKDLLEGRFSVLGNILIDTYGFRFNQHERRVDNTLLYPNYVDSEEQWQTRKDNSLIQVDIGGVGFPYDEDKMKGMFPETVGGTMLDKLKGLHLDYKSDRAFNVFMKFEDNPDDPDFESTLKFKLLRREDPVNLVKVDEIYHRKMSKEERKRLDVGFLEGLKSQIEVQGATDIRVRSILDDELKNNLNYDLFKDYYNVETVLFKNLLSKKANTVIRNNSLPKLEQALDSWNQSALRFIRNLIIEDVDGNIPTGFSYGADEQQKIKFFDLLYVNPEADPENKLTWFYNKLPQDKILGKSATEHPRVHFLDPAEHGGSYLFPQIYIEPATYNGWMGMMKAFVPEVELCADVDNGFLQMTEIAKRTKKVESSLPVDERLSHAPECRFEIPYDRQLMPANHALLEGIILSTVRTYLTEFILRTMPIFGSIRPGATNFDDSLFAAMSERLEQELSIKKGTDPNIVDGYTYYLLFLEQTVQVVQRQIKDGLIEETKELKQAARKISRVQNQFKKLNLNDPDVIDELSKGSAIAGYGTEWEDKYNSPNVFEKVSKFARLLSPFKVGLARKLAVIHDSKDEARVFLDALLKKEATSMTARLMKNLRPLPHVWDVNKMAISKNGIISQSQIRSGEAVIESEVIAGEGKPYYGMIIDCPSSDGLSNFHIALKNEPLKNKGEMFLEKYIRTISKDSEEQVMTISEFETLISSLDKNSKISDNFGNAEILNGELSGTIGVKFGVRLIYVPHDSLGLSTNLDKAKERVGKIGEYEHIPMASFEHDLIDRLLSEIDFSKENVGEDLKCYVDGLSMTNDFKLIFGTLIKTRTFTSLFGIYSFHNFFESIGFKEVQEDRVDKINKKWKRKIFDDTKQIVKKQFRQIYRLDDDDIKDDSRREKRHLDAQFVSNLLPDAYLGLDSSVRWWQSWRIVDTKPSDCENEFQKIFKD